VKEAREFLRHLEHDPDNDPREDDRRKSAKVKTGRFDPEVHPEPDPQTRRPEPRPTPGVNQVANPVSTRCQPGGSQVAARWPASCQPGVTDPSLDPQEGPSDEIESGIDTDVDGEVSDSLLVKGSSLVEGIAKLFEGQVRYFCNSDISERAYARQTE
jgi:hypothetical protein